MLHNFPDDFEFVEYSRVWSYNSPPLYSPEFQIDILANPKDEAAYTLIGEIKNTKEKFSISDAEKFVRNANEVVKLERIQKPLLFVYSINGFYKNTIAFLKNNGVAWSNEKRLVTAVP